MGAGGLSTSSGGGALFAIIDYPVIKYLTPVGTYVLFVLLIFADVFLIFRAAITGAIKRSRKGFSEGDIEGYKQYPDDAFDFTNLPEGFGAENKLFDAKAQTANQNKKNSRSDRDVALKMLYTNYDKGERTDKKNPNAVTDFGGQSYQSRYDEDYRNISKRPYSSPRYDLNDTVNARKSYSEGEGSVYERSRTDQPTYRRGSNFEVPGARIQNTDYTTNDRDLENYRTRRGLSEEETDDEPFTRGETSRFDAPETDDERKTETTNVEDFSSRFVDHASTTAVNEPDLSPFSDKWNIAQTTKTDSAANNPSSDAMQVNSRSFDLRGEKKSVYIESNTGDAVMPKEERAPEPIEDSGEQIPILEQDFYVGVSDMPIKYRYKRPPLDLYDDTPKNGISEADVVGERCSIIEQTLENFNIPAHVENVVQGPTITRYEISIPQGISVNRVPPRASDLAMRLAVEAVRIEAPIPGKNLIGIEVPNKYKEKVGIKELLAEKDFQKSSPDGLFFVLGEDVVGNPVITDLTKTPHLLVAGATGMGKSVFLNSLIMSLITKYGPDDLRLVLVDPKQVEFSIYENIPQLLNGQILTEASECIGILDWAIDEMQLRYKIFRGCYAQKIDEYNHSIDPKTQRKMPKIVIIIDELGDLFSISPQIKHDIEDRIKRLTQKARAAGIHVVVATQRPDVSVITGVIKTNLPARVAFKVLNFQDSNTIINSGGADKLLGNGDMIFKTANSSTLQRIQGSYVSKEEIVRVLNYIKENNTCYYYDNVKKYLDAKKASTQNGGYAASASFDDGSDTDSSSDKTYNGVPIRYIVALKYVIGKKQASISMLQRAFACGYSTAGRIIDWMERCGYISPFDGAKARNVTITMEKFEELYGGADLTDES